MSATIEESRVGWQTLRKVGRTETLHHVELLQCIRDYQLKAEFSLVRVVDTLVRRKQVLPLIGLLVVADALSRSPRFILCA
jgi:hypothetical protein